MKKNATKWTQIARMFHKKKSLYPLIFLQLLSFNVLAQITIIGTVKNPEGKPISNVSVLLKGSNNGVTTDINGNYSINLTDDKGTLAFSFTGMKSQEVAVFGNRVINIDMEEDIASLQNVVVIGYGKQSRKTITTSVSKLDSKVLENIPYTNLASAMQGTLSGVRVQSISGQPGAAPRVIIRGGTSINNPDGAAPLYIIDGVLRPIDNLATEDIESLQVLKDAAATAIYGSRGSNGVVIITTKSGRSGKTRIDYNYDLTISNPGKLYDLASARDYITLQRLGQFADPKFGNNTSNLTQAWGYGTGNDLTNNTGFTTQYLTPDNKYKLSEGWESMPDPVDPSKTLIFKETDFQKLTYQTAISHNHHINISGGTDKAAFNMGIGYLNATGTVITTKYDRLSFNLNGEIKVRDNLSFYGRVIFSNSQQNTPNAGTNVVFYRSAGLAPTAKFMFEDGTIAPGGSSSSIGNPVYYMNKIKADNSTDNLTMTTGSHFEILPGLSFDPQLSMFNISSDGYSFRPAYFSNPQSYIITRAANASNSRWRQLQADAVFSYTKNIGLSHFNGKAGFSYFKRTKMSLLANGRGASTDLIPTLNASAQATSVSSTISDLKILGYFSRLSYDYDQKYLFSASVRYDGASNLGENNKWGLFPGVSIGWNIDKEKFWKILPDGFSTFKIRASYGENGNISALDDFTSQGNYGVGVQYGGAAAIQNTAIPNPDLKWEQSKTFDIGADIGLFNRRINLLFDYYKRITSNLITTLPLPPSTGFSSVLTNLGTLQNKGFEIELNTQILPSKSAFQWDFALNAAKTKSKILKLPPNGAPNNRVGGYYIWDSKTKGYAWFGGLQEGSTMGDMFSRKQIGVYATDADALSAPTDTYIGLVDKTKFGGDTKWQDSDGNGIIDSRDKVFMGNMYPVWTGGLSNTFSLKNWRLYARLDFTLGHTIFNWARMFMDADLYTGIRMTKQEVEQSWKKQGDIAERPRYYFSGVAPQYNVFDGTSTSGNSTYYESGDFLAIREITLSYNLPSKYLSRIKINSLRFNISGNNLHYFTNYLGLNPEEGGRDDGRYAMPKSLIFSANIVF